MTQQTNVAEIKEEALFEVSDVAEDNAFDEVEATATEAEAKPALDSKLKIKYNGTEEEIDLATQREEAIALIQKGKNYDHVLQERDALKDSEEIKFLRELAKEQGIEDTKEFMKKVRMDLDNIKIENRMRELVEEGMSDEHAKYTAELELKSKQATPQAKQEEKPDQGTQHFQELMTKYPETLKFKTLEDFPESVANAIREGEVPIVAYQAYLLEQAQQKQAKLEQVANNRERDMGSLNSGSTEDKVDYFLSGLSR